MNQTPFRDLANCFCHTCEKEQPLWHTRNTRLAPSQHHKLDASVVPPKPHPKPRRKWWLAAVPFLCLLCPAHLLGVAGAYLGFRQAFLAEHAQHHAWWLEALWMAGGGFVLLACLLWERWAHRRSSRSTHCHYGVHQHHNHVEGDLTSGDLSKE